MNPLIKKLFRLLINKLITNKKMFLLIKKKKINLQQITLGIKKMIYKKRTMKQNLIK